MATLQELEEKINHLESELYETKMIAYSSFNSLKSSNCALGYRFNLLNPKTLNGKLNWLALNY